ncbi:MAG TPA: EVE domain-containing protein [Thiobacillaceae bacterium]|nr:EVE domain-containing protein [Thiobacillaceae bacterium]
MRYWLMKSEPSEYSIDDLARDGHVAWFGVRNYQARNFMRDQMKVGDGVLFYHSSCEEPGVAGLAEVSRLAYPDGTQFEAGGKYFDPKATLENPRWFNVEVRFKKKTTLLSIADMRASPQLANMRILAKGNRLSITPVDPDEWKFILARIGA